MSNKYQEIIKYIEGIIEEEKLKPGNKLPSVRSVSDKFSCSKSTVLRAYKELESNHVVYSVAKSGYYLVESNKTPTILDSNSIDFSSVAPDSSLLPYMEFQHSLNQAIDLYKKNLFSYNAPQGLLSFRDVISKHLQEYQVFTSPKEIFVTSGSQQALNLLSMMPFPNGNENILVEQPTYGIMVKLLQLNKINAVGIQRTHSGIDFEELERIFRSGNIKFFYTIPRFHNPTGASYSTKEKKQILHLAEKYNVYIVEDDYIGDLDLDSKVDPIYSYDTTSRVIYVKSFSKTLLPGLRIGVVVLPKLLTNSFLNYKKCADLNSSILSQAALEIFIKSGMFKGHIKKVKNFYYERMQTLNRVFKEYDSKLLTSIIPETGLFAWFNLPYHISSELLRNRLLSKNIYISDSTKFYLPDFKDTSSFRLSICKTEKEQIQKGLDIIFEEVEFLSSINNTNRKEPLIL